MPAPPSESAEAGRRISDRLKAIYCLITVGQIAEGLECLEKQIDALDRAIADFERKAHEERNV
jgi:hypothetical protein